MGSKGKGRRGRFQPDRSAVMKQVQQLQEQIVQTQQALADETDSVSGGGWAV